MADESRLDGGSPETFAEMMSAQGKAAAELLDSIMPSPAESVPWVDIAGRLQSMWLEFAAEQATKTGELPGHYVDPGKWLAVLEGWYKQMPLADADAQKKLWGDGLALWETVLGQFGIGPKADTATEDPTLPRSDRRFADPKWRQQPFFAVIHQTYLMLAEQIMAMADGADGVEPGRKEQLRFISQAMVDALSPANFPLTNPLVMERAINQQGESLIKGMEHLIADLRRGQLTHTAPAVFRLGANIAVTPGKVVYETPLYQVIQYTPVTDKVRRKATAASL